MTTIGLTPLGRAPAGWSVHSLRELAEGIWRGITPSYVDSSPYIVVNQRAIRWGRLDYSVVKYLDASQVASVPPEKFLRLNDVVLNSTGDITIGRAYVIAEPVVNHVPDSHVTTIRLRPNSLHPHLLVQLLGMPRYQREIYAVTSGSTGQLELGREAIGGLVFPIPPWPEQMRIAGVLDSVDEAIQSTQAVIEATEDLRKALAQELLTRGMPGWHNEWKHVPGIGTVPAGWGIMQLGEVTRLQTGLAKNERAAPIDAVELPYLRVANVQDGYLDLTEVKSIAVERANLARYALRSGDVLFTEGGDFDKLGRGTVWRAPIEPCLHQNHVFAVRPEQDRLLPDYLALYAAGLSARRYFLRASKQTTNLASINATQLRHLPVALPALDEQWRIVAAIGRVDERLKSEGEALSSATNLKHAVADAFLTGRVRAGREQ